MAETLNTPRLARNAPFTHLDASRVYQSMRLSVHMAKIRHSGRMFGPKRDSRCNITAKVMSAPRELLLDRVSQ